MGNLRYSDALYVADAIEHYINRAKKEKPAFVTDGPYLSFLVGGFISQWELLLNTTDEKYRRSLGRVVEKSAAQIGRFLPRKDYATWRRALMLAVTVALTTHVSISDKLYPEDDLSGFGDVE